MRFFEKQPIKLIGEDFYTSFSTETSAKGFSTFFETNSLIAF